MSEVDQQRDALQQKFDKALIVAVEYGLEGAVGHAGGELQGISVKFGELDCLMTLRAVLPGGRMVAFVGAATLADCFRKAVNDAYRDNLRWKEDGYPAKED